MRIRISLMVGLAVMTMCGGAIAQSGTGTLRGQIKDPSGAVIVGANVLITPATGQPVSVDTNKQGAYEVKGLAPGKYRVEAIAKGFALFEKDDVQVKALQITEVDMSLEIEVTQQKVTVNANAPTLDVNPANNAGAIVISGKELDALSDDPDELQSDLQALAGPAAGPNGGQMYIDGFTAGQLPPKSSIREIRINSNPFSTEYDKLGYGRIEIFTKPGTDKFHGQGEVQGNDSSFNSRNPFATTEPGYDNVMFSGDLSGPISKKASFFVSGFRRNINDVTVQNACVLSNDTNPQLFGAAQSITPRAGTSLNCNITGWVPFTDSVPTPRTRSNVSPRVDYQLTKNNTLSMRYQYWRNNQQNQLGSPLDVPTQASNSLGTEQTVQLDDSQIIGSAAVNDTRFQFLHDSSSQIPISTLPSVSVLGTFNAGGNNGQTIQDNSNSYELQNNTQMVTRKHTLNYGGRLRWTTDDSSANSNFSGQFSFAGPIQYQTTEQNIANGQPANANGGGANQLAITLGSPNASISYADLALYFQDDWRVRLNLTISPGLRFETQSGISDHADWAPRIAMAWGIGSGKGSPKWVIRAGTGIFYDRFSEGLLMQATRLNGLIQQQVVIPSPTCFFATTPAMPVVLSQIESQCGSVSQQALPTVYRIAPSLRAPGMLQSAVSVERQLTKIATVAVTYINSRGWDQLLTNNINTPLPGTYNPANPATAVYPTGTPENIYQFESEGVYRQNQLMTNLTVRAGSNLTLFGYYSLNYAKADASGAGSFPSNPYDISADYGRASFDIRNRVFFGGSVGAPWGLRLSPFMIFSSGQPYNITIPQDLIGSSQFNQRPSFAASPTEPNAVTTPLGVFDTVPQPGEELVPINSETGPNHFTLNLRVSKTFSFGKEGGSGGQQGPFGGGGGGRRGGGGRGGGGMVFGGGPGRFGQNAPPRKYNLTLSVSGRNVFNHVNLATPTGVLGSPFFGISNGIGGGPFSSASANRLIYLQASFSF